MLVAITYDLDKGWDEVRAAAFAGPFFNIMETNAGQRLAPNTTLFVTNKTTAEALAAFDAAVATASVKLGQKINVERVFAARVEDWRMRSELPKQRVA